MKISEEAQHDLLLTIISALFFLFVSGHEATNQADTAAAPIIIP